MCGGHRRTCGRLWNFSLSSLWRKKKSDRIKELTAVKFEPDTAGSEITELPTKPRGSWRVQMIEKAICVWYVLVSLSCRYAFFATSIFEISNSKFVVFSMLTRELVLFQEIVLLYMARFREGCFAGRRHSQTLLLKLQPARMSVKSRLLHRNRKKETMICGGKSKYITNLGTRNYVLVRSQGRGLYRALETRA